MISTKGLPLTTTSSTLICRFNWGAMTFSKLEFHLFLHSVMLLQRSWEGAQSEGRVKTNVFDHVDKKDARFMLKSQGNRIIQGMQG